MQKEIKKAKGQFVIGYLQNSDDIKLYDNANYSDLIKVLFIPNLKIKEQECKKYLNDFIPELENEIKIIINENQSFYKNFNISFDREFTGVSLFRDDINPDTLNVSDTTMYVNSEIKQF